MLYTIELKIDELDNRAIHAAIAEAQAHGLPDFGHDDANIAGRAVAEICRGWLDMLGKWNMPGQQEPPHAD